MVPLCENLGRHDVAFVAYSAHPTLGFSPIFRRAYDDDVVVIPDFALHEFWQLVAGNGVPVVQANVDAVRPQLSGQVSHPRPVRFVVPGVRKEGCRIGGHEA